MPLFVSLLKRERYEVVIYTQRRGTNLGARRTNQTAEMVGGDATRSVLA